METQNIADSQELLVELSDAAWNSILPFLRDCRNVYVGTPEKCRHFLSAVLWITKEGATWRALPKVYGNWNAIYRRFSRWCDAGVLKHCMNIFTMRVPSQVSSLIPRSCAHMPRQQVPLKKRRTRGTGTRTNSRQIYDETESLSQRCLYTVAFYFDSGTP